MIRISEQQNKFYIWTAHDACRVRKDYRIVGNLVGCLPRAPLQNIHLGLPLMLMKQEARLLVEKKFAVIDNQEVRKPSPEDVLAFQEKRKQLYEEQVEASKRERKRKMLENMDRIVEGKRKKLEKQCEATGKKFNEAEMLVEIQKEIDAIEVAMLLEKHSLVQIHTAKIEEEEAPSRYIHTWDYPSTPREELLYRVFKYFWEGNHFITSGGKFGGDYLVYPGDPSRFHSWYIAVCVEYDEPIGALEIIRLGRLGSSVGKTAVLCSVDHEDKIRVTSIQYPK